MAHGFIVNINGTSASALVDEFCAVMSAARALEARLAALTVHGRDYQSVPAPEAQTLLEAAQAERNAHIYAVQAVAAWALEGALHAKKQGERA